MAVAPPAFTEKLSLAFVPGQLKALAPLADQNVDDIISPNLATITRFVQLYLPIKQRLAQHAEDPKGFSMKLKSKVASLMEKAIMLKQKPNIILILGKAEEVSPLEQFVKEIDLLHKHAQSD